MAAASTLSALLAAPKPNEKLIVGDARAPGCSGSRRRRARRAPRRVCGVLARHLHYMDSLDDLPEHLAAEVGPAVRVNAVCPGLVRTDFARALWDAGRGDAIAEVLPLKRLGEPEDIARTVLFLASDASSWMTGHAVLVDGGQLVSLS